MITRTGMHWTKNLSHMDKLNLGCSGCHNCFIELKKKKKGRYQCFEQLYMTCSYREIYVSELKPPVCYSFVPKNGPDGMWFDKETEECGK